MCVIESYQCKDISITSAVHPDDTVLASQLGSCQQVNVLLSPVESPRNAIDVYVTDCNNVTIHSESKNYTSPTYPAVDSAIVIIDQSHKSRSNYFVTSTTVEVVTHLTSPNATDVFMCLFRNSSIFDKFLYPDSREHFFNILNLATWCDKVHVTSDTTRRMAFTINSTGYYFAGISALQLSLESLQFNVSLTRNFYNRSDFLQDHVNNCHLTQSSSNCSVRNSYLHTCIMLHATSIDIDDFDMIKVDAPKVSVYRSTMFRIVLISVGTFSLILLFIIIITTLVIKLYFFKSHTVV